MTAAKKTSDKEAKTGTSDTASAPAGTASPEEVARFTAIAEGWWDPDGDFKPLHQLNPPRISFIRDHICSHFDRDAASLTPFEGLKVIDIGCGGGLLSEPMSRLGATVTAIDAGEKNIQIASLHAEQSGLKIDYRHILPEEMAKIGDTYDIVLNMEVIEHVADLNAFMAASARLLKPNGLMFFSTLNRTLKSLALAKIGAEYILRWLPIGTHDWKKFVKPSELAQGLRPHGVDLKALQGISFNPVKDEWHLSNDLDINYMGMGVKEG